MLPEIVLTFHCLNKLFKWSQKICKFSNFNLEFQKFFSTIRTIFFLTVGQNNFGNKISFFNFFFKKAKAASALRNRLWSEVKQTSHGDNIFFQYIKPPHSIVKWSNFTIPFHYQYFGNLKLIQQTHQNCWKLKNK